MIEDLGCVKNVDVIARFAALRGATVIDAGCGDMAFSQELVSLGANVIAIDPDAAQAVRNLQLPKTAGLKFVEAGAEHLPAEDRSIDGVFFIYSLHHVPQDLYPRVFAEVIRVLKPDGFLYVIEPTGCPLNDVMRLFHDEEAERAAAQQALQQFAVPAFHRTEVVDYHNLRRFESYEDFARQFSSRTFNAGYTERDIRHPKVQQAFEAAGHPDYCFIAPKRVMFCQGLK